MRRLATHVLRPTLDLQPQHGSKAKSTVEHPHPLAKASAREPLSIGRRDANQQKQQGDGRGRRDVRTPFGASDWPSSPFGQSCGPSCKDEGPDEGWPGQAPASSLAASRASSSSSSAATTAPPAPTRGQVPRGAGQHDAHSAAIRTSQVTG